jgi:hypothetical protein
VFGTIKLAGLTDVSLSIGAQSFVGSTNNRIAIKNDGFGNFGGARIGIDSILFDVDLADPVTVVPAFVISGQFSFSFNTNELATDALPTGSPDLSNLVAPIGAALGRSSIHRSDDRQFYTQCSLFLGQFLHRCADRNHAAATCGHPSACGGGMLLFSLGLLGAAARRRSKRR